MKAMQRMWLAGALALFGMAPQARAVGEVVSYIEAKNHTNPAPSGALKRFSHFEISPVAMGAPYAGQDANEAGRMKLQSDIATNVQPVLDQWNSAAAQKGSRTLKIEPRIRHIKTVSGAVRFFAGGLVGGSALLVTVKLSDTATGEVIAEPEFYQHANKRAAGLSMGGADRAVFARISNLIADYLRNNYEQAVGGPTGKP